MLAFIKKSIISSAVLVFALLPVLCIAPVQAVDEGAVDAACEGIGSVGADCGDSQATGGIEELIGTAINMLSWIVGVASVFMIIIGGFKYVTAQGDSNNITSAKNTIMYAIIGLVIAALAQGLVLFVLKATTT